MVWSKKSFCGCTRRAVKDSDKALKRQELLQVAADLFLKKDFHTLSMDDVAATAKVAKGTLYLYFKTKEELALGVLTRDTAEYLSAFHNYLVNTPNITVTAYAQWVCSALRARPRYLKFMPITALILEKNISKTAAREFKLMIAEQVNQVAPLVRNHLGFASMQQTVHFLLQTHALVTGLHPCCFPSPVIAEIIIEEDLGIFNNDFFEILESSIITLLRGYQQQDQPTSRA